MQAIVCRSPVEIAEDLLLATCTVIFRDYSESKHIGRDVHAEEFGKQHRLDALALVEVWEGTPEQVLKAHDLYHLKMQAFHRKV